MIKFIKPIQETPYLLFKKKYHEALTLKQKNIEAAVISSYSKTLNEVDSRYVNLKVVDGKEFIFFSNYNSKKSEQFESNKSIAALFFWNRINTQIRMKANISKIDETISDIYFSSRQKEKNALAISSQQSEPIKSFDLVSENYLNALGKADLKKRPSYWGGYGFVPYEFEFWVGHQHRLNKRIHFKRENNEWKETLLQP